MQSIARECHHCGKYFRREITEFANIECPNCKAVAILHADEGKLDPGSWSFKSCPFCNCKHFYRQKDFNQVVGLLIVLIGAVLAPFTYGLSLPVLVLVDWWLYRRVADVGVCYRCRTEFRGFPGISETISSFDHHTAELYEPR